MGLTNLFFPSASSPVPNDLEEVTARGEELSPVAVGLPRESIEDIWSKTQALYRSGAHPALQFCIRHRGAVLLHRAMGYASGNSPADSDDAAKRKIGLDTPVNLFSASKAVTAMLIHKLDEENILCLDDPVADYIPDFARFGKEEISLRHVLAHRAGLSKLPGEYMDLDLLGKPERVLEILCDARPESKAGGRLAYHALTGGFILAEVARRATGRGLREVFIEKIREPLGLKWLNYGVAPDQVGEVAQNAATGPPLPPPFSGLLQRALSADLANLVELSNDARFLTGVIPSANIISTASEIASFYQCLLDEGMYEGERVFEAKTIRRAVARQTGWELDHTLMAPIPYGLGFMLGSRRMSLIGFDNPMAFGHVGLSNVFTWADPERQLVVALLTTGKPIIGAHIASLLGLIWQIGHSIPRLPRT